MIAAELRAAQAALGRVLLHPTSELPTLVEEARRHVLPLSEGAATALSAFAAEAAEAGQDGMEQRYARSFDLAPACAPYLSVHLFGDDNYRRAPLMVGLATAYERRAFDPRPELPDHVAAVLRFAPHFTDDEWDDLVRLCLTPALERMARDLQRASSPYRHVLDAVRLLLAAEHAGEPTHA